MVKGQAWYFPGNQAPVPTSLQKPLRISPFPLLRSYPLRFRIFVFQKHASSPAKPKYSRQPSPRIQKLQARCRNDGQRNHTSLGPRSAAQHVSADSREPEPKCDGEMGFPAARNTSFIPHIFPLHLLAISASAFRKSRVAAAENVNLTFSAI